MTELDKKIGLVLEEIRGIEVSAAILQRRCNRARKELERLGSAKAPLEKEKEGLNDMALMKVTQFIESRNSRILKNSEKVR